MFEYRVDRVNGNEIKEAKRLYIYIDGQEFIILNRNGKLEITSEEELKLTMGGGCNLIYIEENNRQ